jgi:potassium voltage-gated channel Eag-related subfamily H protein 7
MQFTVETENNLIISDFKPEDCVDFLSMESISDIGAQFNYKQSNQI